MDLVHRLDRTRQHVVALVDHASQIEKYAADHIGSVAQADPPIKRIKVAVIGWLSQARRCLC
jgi:hypothetical protein